jgi:glycosyltransferase involved in cell wall biosynthesis
MRAIDGFLFTAAAQAEAWRERQLITGDQPVYEVLEGSTGMRPIERDRARVITGIAGDPAVLWVGRLDANKSPLTILDGVERAIRELPGLTLTMIYAAGDLEQVVRTRIARTPALSRRVRLAGRVAHDGLAAFYSAADLFTIGSHHEGSGYALVEACACGLVPIVTDIPSFRTMTRGGAIGALWPVDDAAALAAAWVAAAAAEREPAREHVQQHFDRELSWPAIARRALAAYDDAASRRRARASGVVN